jgi:hypothetical protein
LTTRKKCVNLVIYVREKRKNKFYDLKEKWRMLNDEICKLRDELNKSIEEEKDYDTIYNLSVKLDELIAEFYRI